jgi:hypothetical protein
VAGWVVGRIYGCKLQIDFSCGAQERKLVIVLILIPKLSLGVIGSQCYSWVALDPEALGVCWIPKLSWGPVCWGSQLKDIFIITKA